MQLSDRSLREQEKVKLAAKRQFHKSTMKELKTYSIQYFGAWQRYGINKKDRLNTNSKLKRLTVVIVQILWNRHLFLRDPLRR